MNTTKHAELLRAANEAAARYFEETDPDLKTLRYAQWTAAARRLKWCGEDLRDGEVGR